MLTSVKNEQEIQAMREGGKMLADIHRQIKVFARPGCTGRDVDELARRELKAFGAEPAFLGYNGFPSVICISVNDEVVHGIPGSVPFQRGDLVGFDFGVLYKGLVTDSAFSMFIGGTNNKKAQQLLEATERSLRAGIAVVKDGVTTGDIGAAVQSVLDQANYGIVRELVGHGVGHHMHEEPDIPNYGTAGKGRALRAGMTIAIEPMATLGDRRVLIDSDGWTVRTRDGSLSAHVEHTLLITSAGADILTVS